MRLIQVIIREIPENLRSLLMMALLSSLATTSLMWLVDEAAQNAAKGEISRRLVLMFAVTVTTFAVADNYVLVTASRDAEQIIHRLRIRLFDAIRRADLIAVEKIGRTALFSALTQDTQTCRFW